MKTFLAFATSFTLLCLAGCASQGDASAREWERAECNRVIDQEARERCMERTDSGYRARGFEKEKPARR